MTECGRRSVIGIGALSGVLLATGGCFSLPGSRRQAQDDRFATFTEYVPKKLDVKTELEQLEKWMPGAHPSKAHWVMQYRQEKREMLPYPDRPLWVNAVLVLDSEVTKAFVTASTGKVDRLPGIYPDLHQYVPEGDVFTTVPKEKADEILDVEHMIQDDPNIAEPHHFQTDQAVICSDSNLLILIATEWHT